MKTVALIVAHPDDETLWAGGTILSHTMWQCFIISLCRGNDTKRAPRYYKALKILNSEGIISNLDDGIDQIPQDEKELSILIMNLLPQKHYDLIITHNPTGEYTRHRRHEEASYAVINLWHAGKIIADELWTFAYEDGNGKYYPRAVEKATLYYELTQQVWSKKYNIITDTYGFSKDSWEAKTTPRAESFWQFKNPEDAKNWLKKGDS